MSNRIINAAAQGLRMSCQHPHFNDVNPIRRQTLTNEDKARIRAEDDAYVNRVARRQAWIKSKGGRILPTLSK